MQKYAIQVIGCKQKLYTALRFRKNSSTKGSHSCVSLAGNYSVIGTVSTVDLKKDNYTFRSHRATPYVTQSTLRSTLDDRPGWGNVLHNFATPIVQDNEPRGLCIERGCDPRVPVASLSIRAVVHRSKGGRIMIYWCLRVWTRWHCATTPVVTSRQIEFKVSYSLGNAGRYSSRLLVTSARTGLLTLCLRTSNCSIVFAIVSAFETNDPHIRRPDYGFTSFLARMLRELSVPHWCTTSYESRKGSHCSIILRLDRFLAYPRLEEIDLIPSSSTEIKRSVNDENRLKNYRFNWNSRNERVRPLVQFAAINLCSFLRRSAHVSHACNTIKLLFLVRIIFTFHRWSATVVHDSSVEIERSVLQCKHVDIIISQWKK